MAAACVKKCGNFLELRSEPAESPLHHFSPKDFIYNVRKSCENTVTEEMRLVLSVDFMLNLRSQMLYFIVTIL